MAKPSTIQVIIADDHAIVCEGLRQILAETRDIQVMATAGTGYEAVECTRKTDCHVLLLDISLPDRNGIEVLKQIRKEYPAISVLMLSMHREDQYAIRALKAGAAGYLNKQSAPAELVAAIRQVAAGRKYISVSLAQELANNLDKDHDQPPHATLSDREYQTMVMIASGKTVGDIAAELKLSVKTISMYRARLLQKMELRHNAEVTHYAIKNGLVEE